MAKPEVEFKELIGWIDDVAGGIRARLEGISGHPDLGDEPGIVRTSAVVRIAYAPNGEPTEIETKNTIYRAAP